MSKRYEHRPRIQADRFYRVCEMAQLLDISLWSAYQLVQKKEIKAKKIGVHKGIWRISGKSILNYLEY